MDDFFAVNAGFPKPNCTRTDGLEPRIVPGPALWTHNKMIRAEPVRDLRSEGPPPNSYMEASMLTDKMHVVHPRAAGLDVHKMEITATCVRRRAAIPRPRPRLSAPWRAECAISWRGCVVTA